MNDLMTKSFLSYVELKKQAQLDLETERDLEMGQLSRTDEDNLSNFFHEIEVVKVDIEEITNLLIDLQNLNEETKITHGPKVLRGLRDRMDSNMVSVLRKAKIVKAKLEALDISNVANRKLSVAYAEGTVVDRTRVNMTNGLRVKLRDIMNEFQALREKIISDYKDCLRRRYYNETGEEPTEEVIEKMVSGGSGKVEIFAGKTEMNVEEKDRHEAVMDIQKSLEKLHQVFLDMAVLVETQGEQLDDIERNMATAGSFISGGTNSLFYAKQHQKKGVTWVCWVLAVVFIILMVCFIAMLIS
ncbi:syntaxin-112-like [Nicotiana tabacum]|uniref:Syntaxin-112-like n=1 Tax=Nicotiana tabacum TaxID=4097 RepID=A0A1S4A0M3_TOBAC|nr:syntaxin-112-like [Nicotiana tomentosiformis]XP_016470188.1 PREDICTED: syntaxin-112-like [Nicotiana tabacum]XP_033511042.1 syntaxin-112-like [Nicotiana tomentosiformis]